MGKVHMEVTFTFADGRIATCEGVRKNRRQFSTVHVWAGDPFYEPALATIENFWMQENSPRAGCMIDAACNRNFKGECCNCRLGLWSGLDCVECTVAGRL